MSKSTLWKETLTLWKYPILPQFLSTRSEQSLMILARIMIYSDGCIHHPLYLCESKIVLDGVGRYSHPLALDS